MARKWAENHRIRAIHLHGRLNGVLVEFLQGAINANLAPTTIPPCPLHPIIIEDLIICKHGALTLCLASLAKLWAHWVGGWQSWNLSKEPQKHISTFSKLHLWHKSCVNEMTSVLNVWPTFMLRRWQTINDPRPKSESQCSWENCKAQWWLISKVNFYAAQF